MKRNIIIATIMAAALPVDAFEMREPNLPYTFGEIAYTDRDYGDDSSVDGLLIGGSYELTSFLFVNASYADLSDSDISSNLTTLGVGAAMGITPMMDAYFNVNYINADYDIGDQSGMGIEVGARSMVAEKIEVFGNIQYVDMDDDSELGLQIGGRYWHLSHLGFSASYTEHDLLGSGVTIAARYNF